MQVLQKRWDKTFSEQSYGFRPGRSAHQAVRRAQKYIEEGKRWVVDIDLSAVWRIRPGKSRYSDEPGRLAGQGQTSIETDTAVLDRGGVENGLVSPSVEGTPQGGPLSPLLSNLLLDELDKELERRGHRFVRYPDDCNIYVCTHRAGERVMASISRFLTGKLKLKINPAKSAVTQPCKRELLGISFTSGKHPKLRLSPESIGRFKERVRELTGRSSGKSIPRMVEELSSYQKGWRASTSAFSEL